LILYGKKTIFVFQNGKNKCPMGLKEVSTPFFIRNPARHEPTVSPPD
jgi:hypothetical protein